MNGREEKIVCWLKFKDHHGERPTSLSITTPDDDRAFPVYRTEQYATDAIHHLNCEIKSLSMQLEEAKELLHKCYRDLNQLNDQSVADDISKFLNK